MECCSDGVLRRFSKKNDRCGFRQYFSVDNYTLWSRPGRHIKPHKNRVIETIFCEKMGAISLYLNWRWLCNLHLVCGSIFRCFFLFKFHSWDGGEGGWKHSAMVGCDLSFSNRFDVRLSVNIWKKHDQPLSTFYELSRYKFQVTRTNGYRKKCESRSLFTQWGQIVNW